MSVSSQVNPIMEQREQESQVPDPQPGTSHSIQQSQEVDTNQIPEYIHMEFVVRISKLPIVHESLNVTSNLYGKVKKSNCMSYWFFKKAGIATDKAIESTVPVQKCIQRPVKTLDNFLCYGLDYLEEKVPAVKLPPHEMYQNAKKFVRKTTRPCVKKVVAVKNYGLDKMDQIKNCALTIVLPSRKPVVTIQDPNDGEKPSTSGQARKKKTSTGSISRQSSGSSSSSESTSLAKAMKKLEESTAELQQLKYQS